MKSFRSLKHTSTQLSARSMLVPSIVVALLGMAHEVRAELTAEFRDKFEVDPEYAPGVNGATDIAWAGDGRAVITRRTGQVVVRKPDGTLKTINYPFGMGSQDALDTSFGEKGLLGVVADPNVATNKTFYFYMTNGPSNQDKMRVYKAVLGDDDTLMVMRPPIVGGAGTAPTLEGPLNHVGGGMVVHKGHLYIGVGDSGSNATPPQNKYGSCLNKPNGKILRVNLDGTPVADNPLMGMQSVTSCDSPKGTFGTGAPDTRIYSWGFRNPWRFWIDPQTDLMWVGDVGETTEEEVAVGKGGEHFGYPFVEGMKTWNNFDSMKCNDVTPGRDCTPAVYSYPTNKGAVIGGLIPTGCGWDEAFGGPHYLFGDSDKDWIRAIPVKSDRTGVSSTTAKDFDMPRTGSNLAPASFRMGPDQSLYVVMHEGGAVFRYTPKNRTGPGCEPGMGGGGAGGGSASGGSGGGGTGAGGSPATGGTGSPAGGAMQSGGAAPTAGAANPTGGTSTNGGSGGMPSAPNGGTAGSGGTMTAGAGSPPSAGAPVAAGSPSVAGAPPTSGGGGDSGCGCRVAGSGAGTALSALAIVAAAAGLTLRRRRRSDRG